MYIVANTDNLANKFSSNNASLNSVWICRFLFLHGSVLLSSLCQHRCCRLKDISETRQWSLCFFFPSFYSKLNMIRGWNILREKEYYEFRSHWQYGRYKGAARACFVCCKWIVIVKHFEEEILNQILLPSTPYYGNMTLSWMILTVGVLDFLLCIDQDLISMTPPSCCLSSSLPWLLISGTEKQAYSLQWVRSETDLASLFTFFTSVCSSSKLRCLGETRKQSW